MTDKPAESAVERYNALEWVPDGEMGFDPGGREVKAAADAAIAALQEMVEDLSLGYDAANKVGIERAEQAEADVKYAVGQLEIERRENQLGAERYLQAEAELAELNDAYSRLLSGNGELKDRLDKVEAQKRGLATAAKTGVVAANRVIELEAEVEKLRNLLGYADTGGWFYSYDEERAKRIELESEVERLKDEKRTDDVRFETVFEQRNKAEAELAFKDRMLRLAVNDLSGELYGYPCDDKHLAGWLADLARRAKEAGE